ncbi:hypothetical protein DMUE_4528, partial [Dictyocoela muelleri]
MIKEIFIVLNPIKEALLGITKNDATLMTAKHSFEFIFETLAKINLNLSLSFLTAIKSEYEKRRSGDLLDLFEYFENTNFLNNYKGDERDKKRKMLQSSASDL